MWCPLESNVQCINCVREVVQNVVVRHTSDPFIKHQIQTKKNKFHLPAKQSTVQQFLFYGQRFRFHLGEKYCSSEEESLLLIVN